jgi:hypothetical protein
VADRKSSAQYYGQPVTLKQLLFERYAPRAPGEAQEFRKALPQPPLTMDRRRPAQHGA